MALHFTFLSEEEIWNDDRLEIMRGNKYGRGVTPTDLVVLLRSYKQRYEFDPTQKHTCGVWIRSGYDSHYDYVSAIDSRGDKRGTYPGARNMSARPVLAPSETSQIAPTATKTGVNGVDIVEYGEYPQTVADQDVGTELERLFQSQSLKKTGKQYTFDATDPKDTSSSFHPKEYPEYVYKGEKYIRILAQWSDWKKDMEATNGAQPDLKEQPDKPFWVRVEPIEWLRDSSGTWVSKKSLFSGIQFSSNGRYYGNFNNTVMKMYLDTYFAAEIEPSKVASREIMKGLKEKLSEISDLEQVKKTITPADTPERTETLTRITRVRRAKEVLMSAAQQAKKDNDSETLEEIMEIAKPYAVREAVIRDKLRKKRLERRAKSGKE